MENKLKVSMTMDEILYNKFKIYCQKNGMKISTRVEVLIKNDLEQNCDKLK